MERSKKHRSRRDQRARKAPKVPIKTYRWEDVRRARRRGGYPWTHLYKGPFTEKIDPDQFTMDALRRAKSSSPMGKRSDRVDISEVSSWADYSGKTTPTLLQELISEPQENVSKKGSRPGSVVIEEYVEDEEKDLEDDVQVKEFHTESAESSDNISQYLDRDEQMASASKTGENTIKEVDGETEDTGQRKRKISAESSYSKYSLSKLGVIKKLQDVKKKIKVPKISFSTKKVGRKRSSPPKEEKVKKEAKKPMDSGRARKPEKPFYIHIPLKPPPGEAGKFSHLQSAGSKLESQAEEMEITEIKDECGDKSRPEEEVETTEIKEENDDKSKLEGQAHEVEITEIKEVCEEKSKPEGQAHGVEITEIKETSDSESQSAGKWKEDTKDKISPSSTLKREARVTKKPPLKVNPAFKQFLKDVRELKEASDEKNGHAKQEPSVTSDEISLDLEEQEMSESETSPKEDVFDRLFQASFSKKPAEPPETPRNVRSKSAEPENKRRPSMDSSYSRKSLSKLALVKKLKDASEKIKGAFSMDSLRKKLSKKEEPKVEQEEPKKARVVKTKRLDKPKIVEPVYIHIPLKPPEGQTDEFSYLASHKGVEGAAEPKKEERTDSLDSTSPKNSDIQFIFLTPPSDDEILDKEPDIPETPSSSSDDMVFFSTLKKLAQDVVDQVSHGVKNNALETVQEESVSDKDSNNGSVATGDDQVVKKEAAIINESTTKAPIPEMEEKMIVDVEDGLNEAPKTEECLKSALKTSETTSVKRVSFKRKSKAKDKDKDYEKIEVPKSEEKAEWKTEEVENTNNEVQLEGQTAVSIIEKDQSISVDEEKSDLDQKIVKNASLEEDYNKWSKSAGDHEYELITPPDETTLMTSSMLPNITVLDQDSDPRIIISATEIFDKPLEEKKKPFFQFGRFHREKAQGDRSRKDSSDSQSRSSQGRDLPELDEPPIKANEGPNKFQVAFKQGTEHLKMKTNQLCNKIHNIHMPKTPQFKKPDFKRFKIERPKLNLHLPKIPDSATIHLKNVSLPGARKTTETRTMEIRQFSTESNADDSEQSTKRHKFDLSFGGTFPRFRKTKKTEQEVAFSTVPRAKKETERGTTSSENSSIRIPLRSEDSGDAAERLAFEEATEPARTGYDDRETSVDFAPVSVGHHPAVIVPIDDEYERENEAINRADFLSRWQHGNFRQRKDDVDNEDERIVGQLVEQRFGKDGSGYGHKIETLEERLRRDEERPRYIEDEEEEEEFEIRLTQNKHMITDLDNLEEDSAGQNRDGYSSEGSGSLHRKGRLGKLDIDSDEFFVVHEIREGFQTPANALAQMNEYDPIGSNRSLPMQMRDSQPSRTERKPIKKPKRKKTPHVSQEEIQGEEESIENVTAPSRPKRRSKRTKKKLDAVVSYQETIPVEAGMLQGQRLDFPQESLGILGDDERDEHDVELYENERALVKNRPDPYKQFQILEQRYREKEERAEPDAPPRKHRSLKSLTQSESESILMDNRNLENVASADATTTQVEPPRRPSRKSRSHTSSLSRMSLPASQRDTDSAFTDEGYLAEGQQVPSYLIESQNNKEQYRGFQKETPPYPQEPCVEEPCVQDLRDCMGYAIVDKSKQRYPPLPPPRTPPKRRKRGIEPEQKFSTVPRNLGLNQSSSSPPVRPLRNYSTLSHVRGGRKDSSPYENDQENKENEEEISRYIEIDDEINRDLISGEVVQKMRQRPLPAPPRPPRKPKTTRRSLQDITSKENIISAPSDLKSCTQFQEETVSTQTEPLPPDFECEEVREEPTDTIITARTGDVKPLPLKPELEPQIQRFDIYDPRTAEPSQVRRELLTPSVYSFEETVTHGTLLVQPLGDAKVVPDHQLSKERLVPIARDEDEETSEVPESFRKLRSPEELAAADRKEVLKADTLQVSDLDVDRLKVNQLLASKIIVSEIDSSTISTDEIQGRSGSGGTIRLGDVELPPQLLEQLLRQLQINEGQKKTPINEQPPQLGTPANNDPQQQQGTSTDALRRESSVDSAQQHDLSPEPPVPPPRSCTLEDEATPDAPPRTLRRKSKQRNSPRSAIVDDLDPLRNETLAPEVDDDPPPRPPEPLEGLYLPSQPPASFYALRAKHFVDENIPAVPRRRRRQSSRSRPISRSRSTSDDSLSAPQRPSRLSRPHSEPSIPELSGRLIQACGSRINSSLKRLIYHLTENLLRNADGNQDLHVFMIILLVLIAGLILLGYGEDRTVIHLHHWEYFNPPKDL